MNKTLLLVLALVAMTASAEHNHPQIEQESPGKVKAVALFLNGFAKGLVGEEIGQGLD